MLSSGAQARWLVPLSGFLPAALHLAAAAMPHRHVRHGSRDCCLLCPLRVRWWSLLLGACAEQAVLLPSCGTSWLGSLPVLSFTMLPC